MPRKPKAEEGFELKVEEEQQKEPTLEESFQELDQVISTLERNDINLEESFRLYHKGMELLRRCNNSIDKIEKELFVLEQSGI